MKNFFILTFLIFFAIGVFTYTQLSKVEKVLKITSPFEIYIDKNRNLIFDEKNPISLTSIFYVNENTDLNKFPKLKVLSDDEKFILKYLALEKCKHLLEDKHIKLKNNHIYIKGKEYSKLLLESNLYFTQDLKTQEKVIEYIKNFPINDYVLFNPQTKHYHSLNCEQARNTPNIILMKKSKLKKSWEHCKICFKESKKEQPKLQIEEEKTNKVKKSFETDKIKVFFFELNNIYKPCNKCKSIGCSALKQEIDNAKESIEFAIYGINNQPEIINALINAKNRGVKIRWVCDFNEKHGNYYPDTIQLQRKIPSFNSDKGYELGNETAIMHNKFFIFDNKKVWTGSANITSTDLSEYNSNYSVLIENSEIAKIYKQEFEQMFNGSFHKYKNKVKKSLIQHSKDTRLEVLFSPKDNIIENKIIPLINSAKEYIYIPMFFITHKSIQAALINAHNRGIEIKLIGDATNARTKHTVHRELRKIGIKTKTENYAGKMHAKTLIIDDEISIIGSLNYTKSGNKKNDENIIVIHNKDIAKYLKSTFLYTWNKIPEKYLNYDPMAESIESIGSCFDNIDNDFDDKIDMKDSGCIYK